MFRGAGGITRISDSFHSLEREREREREKEREKVVNKRCYLMLLSRLKDRKDTNTLRASHSSMKYSVWIHHLHLFPGAK